MLFIGHGATLSEAGEELTAPRRALGIPVITSPNGMGCVPCGRPLALGFIGRNGAYPANQAGRHADLVIAIGARFDDRSPRPGSGLLVELPARPGCPRRHRPAELGRNYPPTLGIIADAKVFPAQLAGAANRRGRAARVRPLARDDRGWKREWEAFVRPNFDVSA